MKAPYLVKVVDRWQTDWRTGGIPFSAFVTKLWSVVNTLEQEGSPVAVAAKELWNRLELINAVALDGEREVSSEEIVEADGVLEDFVLLLGGSSGRQGEPLDNCGYCLFIEPCLAVFLNGILERAQSCVPSVVSTGGWCEKASDEGSVHANITMSREGVSGYETGEIAIDIELEGSAGTIKASLMWAGHIIQSLERKSTEVLSSAFTVRGWVRRSAEEAMLWITSWEDQMVREIRIN